MNQSIKKELLVNGVHKVDDDEEVEVEDDEDEDEDDEDDDEDEDDEEEEHDDEDEDECNIQLQQLKPANLQTKVWRREQKWYKGGRCNECELYQKVILVLFLNKEIPKTDQVILALFLNKKISKTDQKILNLFLNKKIPKTDHRIHMKTNQIVDIARPNTQENGFEYTENFDGLIQINECNYYFNLKFVCDAGGGQTRTLREVYHFIEHQLKYIKKNETHNTYFINILDGDTCYKEMDKYNYLINNEEYKDVKKYVFVGSLYEFQKDKLLLQIKD
jgi:hypothetical protein